MIPVTPDLTPGERHILQFISDEWQPVSTIAAFANCGMHSSIRAHLTNLQEKGVIEKKWDENIGAYYWRLKA